MLFISVLIVFLLVQWWGSGAPLHYDQWYRLWCARLTDSPFLNQRPGAVFAAAVAGPTLAVLILYWGLTAIWSWLGLVVAVPVLLYSLGRGEFTVLVNQYLEAWRDEDWSACLKLYERLRAADLESVSIEEGNWQSLHQQMLMAVSYRGFERLFVVVFWFVLLGPAGALLYRLTHLFTTSEAADADQPQAQTWLWLMEWPAARLLGLSFALTGNFVGCFHAWRECLWCTERPTPLIMIHYLHGALGVEEGEPQSDAITHREFTASLSLFSRTWVFWMCLLAVGTVIW